MVQYDSTVAERPRLKSGESNEYSIEIEWSLIGAAEKVFLEMFPREGNCASGCIVDVKTKAVTFSSLTAGKGDIFHSIVQTNLHFSK